MLCRTENYVNTHVGFDGLLRGEKLLSLLSELAGEPVILFKEKINYKLAGSGQLSPLPFPLNQTKNQRRMCSTYRFNGLHPD